MEYCGDENETNAGIRELIIDYFNRVIKEYLDARKKFNLDKKIIKMKVDTKLLEELYKRLESFSAYKEMIDLLDMYRCNFVDFKYDGKLIKLDFNKNYDLLSRIIAMQDFYDKHNVNNMFIDNEFCEKDKSFGCYHDEVVYREKMKNFYMTDDLSIMMGKYFSIDEWIKIFMILIKENVEYWEENRYTLLIKSQREWIKIFQDNGFSKEKASKILEELVFEKESRDIRENPFIKYGNLIVTIPSFVATIDVFGVLISIFNNRNYQLNFKGAFFEKEIKKELELSGIKNCNCKVDQYECDMAFIFDECLFICELKNEFQPINNIEWYKFYKNREKHISQLERIYKFYSSNLQYLLKKLGKPKIWKPKKIFKVLLYSNYLGETIVEKNLIISNWKNVINFFQRAPICINVLRDKKLYILKKINYKMYPYLKKEEKQLIVDDFIAFMKCPMSIWFQREQFELEKRYIGVGGKYVIELEGYLYRKKYEEILI